MKCPISLDPLSEIDFSKQVMRKDRLGEILDISLSEQSTVSAKTIGFGKYFARNTDHYLKYQREKEKKSTQMSG